jgi:hypothetical protein
MFPLPISSLINLAPSSVKSIQRRAAHSKYVAMYFAVRPSAFLGLAVAMCSASSTLLGRPNLVPFDVLR